MTGKPPLKIAGVHVHKKRLGFRMDVAHGLASRFCSDNIYVELVSDSGTAGYGECVPRAYVTGETPESVIASLEALLPQLSAAPYDSPHAVVARLSETGLTAIVKKNPAAFCSAELALLDLAGKYWDLSVPDLLGLNLQVDSLYYSLVTPIFPSDIMERFLSGISGFRFSHAKIKVNGRDPVGYIRRVKSLLPPETEIRVDVNCSWTVEEALEYLPELADAGVVSVEQPLAAGDLGGSARLRGNGVLITLDESISGPDDVDRAAAAGACDIVNVRISKCGGLLGALRVIGAADRRGLGIQLGAQVGESCILSAAGAILAAATPEFRWLEGCFGTHLLREDLCREDFRFGANGKIIPPHGPGLGITIDPDRLT
ncbi:MAG: mandelate racemase/muconate lactonizing enzyme family protein [Candidatus Latescibacterota bacterium]